MTEVTQQMQTEQSYSISEPLPVISLTGLLQALPSAHLISVMCVM